MRTAFHTSAPFLLSVLQATAPGELVPCFDFNFTPQAEGGQDIFVLLLGGFDEKSFKTLDKWVFFNENI